MSKGMQNVVVLMDSNSNTWDTSSKAVNMYLNRICIDEEAAFESIGVHFLNEWEEISVKKILDQNNSKDLKMHFLCTFYSGYWEGQIDILRSVILKEIKKRKIQKAMVTLLYMHNKNLITKENMESYIDGKEMRKESVNDDLESFFEKLRLGQEPTESVRTYFVPKLTEPELKLVAKKDSNYFKNFSWTDQGFNPDVDEIQMKMSDSDSKFVQAFCWRNTFIVENIMLEEFLSEAKYSC